MKIVFAGTPEFALPTLRTLADSSHSICAVYTRPDRPAGRGRRLTATPVKKLALQLNLPLYQPSSLKEPAVQAELAKLQGDILLNVAYGVLLPAAVLNMFKFGGINIHPSLLPHWRGAAPIQRAIMAAETHTGVTIMQMDQGLDTGKIYKQHSLPITPEDTTATLTKRSALLGATLLLPVLQEIERGVATPTPQNEAAATYAHKLTKAEGEISWHKSASALACLIRACNPWPIAYTTLEQLPLRIWQAESNTSCTPSSTMAPGTIIQLLPQGIDVMTGAGVLRLLTIQLPGEKPLLVKEILNRPNHRFAPKKQLGNLS